MTAEDLNARGTKLFGLKQWKKTLAEKTGKDITSIRNWARGAQPVPRYVDTLFDALEKLREMERITSRLAKLR